jgi:hypothetical protein
MRRPNYRFDRAERDRMKQAKKEEKARRQQQLASQQTFERADPVTAKSPAYHNHSLQRILLNLPNATRASAYSSNAVRSAWSTEPCVGTRQAVGQRVTPLVRTNSAIAACLSSSRMARPTVESLELERDMPQNPCSARSKFDFLSH